MAELAFKHSRALTLGVELELQLVKAHDGDLSRDAADLLRRLSKRKLSGEVKPEITESMIELNSTVHTGCGSLMHELDGLRRTVVDEAELLNLGISGGGSHPFHDWSERRIFPTDRFKHLLNRYGYLAKQFTVFGQHIHVGCEGGDDAVYLVHKLTPHLPEFIALSAASPYYQGEETSFQSSRLTAVSAFPLAGHMPYVRTWGEFTAYFERMKALGVIESMKDFYWDIRPKPEYGTIEIRVCDTPLTIRRAVLLAAYAQSLAAYYLQTRSPASQDVYLVNSYNRFEACRFGLRGTVIDACAGTKQLIGERIQEMLPKLWSHAADIGCVGELIEIGALVAAQDGDAGWLRERAAERRSLVGVVRDACTRWMAN